MNIATYAVLARETFNLIDLGINHIFIRLPLGWNIKKTDIFYDENGNCFCLFMNKKLKEVVLSVRGTKNLENIETDFKLALARIQENKFIPAGQEGLEALANKILQSNGVTKEGYSFKIIGYSLGGVMAELCATKLGIECITFESPGSVHLMQQHPSSYPEKNYNLISAYLSAPNAINSLDAHPGNIFRMYLPQSQGYARHAVKCLLNTTFVTPAYNAYVSCFSLIKNAASNNIFASLNSVGITASPNPLGFVEDIAWLIEQHSIENIAKFLLNSGKVTKMDSWPTTPLIAINQELSQSTITQNILSFSKIFLPFQKDKPGIRNIFDEEGMKLAQNFNLPGYKEHKKYEAAAATTIRDEGFTRKYQLQ